MSEQQYYASTYWCDEDFGFRYQVRDSKGAVILESKDAYWYEENAKKVALQEMKRLK